MSENARYSKFVRPTLYLLDLLIVLSLSYLLLSKDFYDLVIIISFWLSLSVYFSFYTIYRFTKLVNIISLLLRQITVFVLIIIAYVYFSENIIPRDNLFYYYLCLLFLFNFLRILLHYIFIRYRLITGNNFRKVIIIGSTDLAKKLEGFFNTQRGYGYRYMGYFTDKNDFRKVGSIDESFKYILENQIDEIYCSVKELNNEQTKKFIDFCDIKVKVLKFLPDNNKIYTKSLHLNYYDLIPILSLRKIPLQDPINSLIKRIFDIIFSLIIIIAVLSWLIPILGLFIIIESEGPIFFRQDRPGIKEKGFGCYKFRSMTINSTTENSASRNDPRVTKIGKFIRKTSIDELPQFFNVLFGEMSVVGPRPHLWRQNELYGSKISKYMVRYFVKPGITGLAQVRGYRGEIESKEDIVNRTKYDIFYIENWSLLMDIKIIIQTIFNVFQGEDKAY